MPRMDLTGVREAAGTRGGGSSEAKGEGDATQRSGRWLCPWLGADLPPTVRGAAERNLNRISCSTATSSQSPLIYILLLDAFIQVHGFYYHLGNAGF